MRSTFFAMAGRLLAAIVATAETSAAALATAAYSTAAAITSTHNNHNNVKNDHVNNNFHNNNYYYNNIYSNNYNNNDSSSDSGNSKNSTENHFNSAFIVTMDEFRNKNSTFSSLISTAITMMTALTTATINTTTAVAAAATSNLNSTSGPGSGSGTTTTSSTLSKFNENNENDYILLSTDGDMDPAAYYVPPLQRPETYIVTVLFTLIFIVGVLGNGTLVIIFFRHRSMRNIPNTYILSLALADLLVIIVCVPMATIVYTQESWTFGVDLCRISEFFKDISIGVSVFTLTALSGERYCAIVNPLRKLQTKPLTVFTATMIWLLAILLGTPSFIVSDLDEVHISTPLDNFTILVCTPFGKNDTNTETYAKYTVISKACIYYLLPLLIIGALYILMAKRLHLSARDMPGESLGMHGRARRHVARMVVAFVVVFFACFFPYHLFELWFHLNPTARDDFDDFWHAVRIIGFCTSFLHSCVNPVTLYCISGVFRQHFNRYLCCLCVKKQPRLRQHSTATAMIDTSIISIRRSNTTSNYNRASLYGGGSGVGGGYQRSSICANNNIGVSGVGIGGGSNGNNALDVLNCGNGSNRNTKAAISPAQSIILSDKR